MPLHLKQKEKAEGPVRFGPSKLSSFQKPTWPAPSTPPWLHQAILEEVNDSSPILVTRVLTWVSTFSRFCCSSVRALRIMFPIFSASVSATTFSVLLDQAVSRVGYSQILEHWLGRGWKLTNNKGFRILIFLVALENSSANSCGCWPAFWVYCTCPSTVRLPVQYRTQSVPTACPCDSCLVVRCALSLWAILIQN